MEWKVCDDGYPNRIVESGYVLALKERMKSTKCKVKVSLGVCDPNLFLSKQDQSKRALGYHGPCGPTYYSDIEEWKQSRSVMNSECVSVTFSFVMSTLNADMIKSHKLVLTPINSDGDTYPVFHISKLYDTIPYKRGVYKREGFDDILQTLRKFKPSLTEKEFAQDRDSEWDTDLTIHRLYDGPTDCMDSSIINEYVETNRVNVRMTLRMIDIPVNLNYINDILSAYCSN